MVNKKASIGDYWLLILFLIVFLGWCFLGFIGIHIVTTHSGIHTGYITAIEENGIIFKTMTVYFKTDTQSSQEDAYCLIDKNLIPILSEKQINKEKVTITFYDVVMPSWSECSGGIAIINGIQ